MQVHAWAEDDVAAILQRLVADGLAHLLHQLGVPRACQTGAHGEARGGIAGGVALALGIDVHAGRAIGHHGGGDAQTGYGHGDAGGTRHQLLLVAQHGTAAHKVVVAAAHQQLCFLLEGHGLHDSVDVGGAELWRIVVDARSALVGHAGHGHERKAQCRDVVYFLHGGLMELMGLIWLFQF